MIKNFKQFLLISLLLVVAGGVQPAWTAIWQWSTTASNNATADPTINWSEGMSPSSVNDSARAMMAAIAAWRNDISRAGTTAGTGTAYTLTTSEGVTSPPSDGQMLAFYAHTTNTGPATLSVDGGTAYNISANGSALPSGTILASTPYRVVYNSSLTRWDLEGLAGNPYNTPLGSVVWTTLATAPNSNFVSANGQCLSTTTYATYWAAIGSPVPGSCAGGQFSVIDLRGRVVAGLDTLPGSSAAGRMTSDANGCGTAFTTMGVVCVNGTQSWTLTSTQIASHYHSASIYDPTHTHSFSAPSIAGPNNNNGGGGGAFAAMSSSVGGYSTAAAATGVRVNSSNGLDTTYSAGGGGAHPSVQPTMGLYPWLRVL